jgi:hypothetical protein
MNAVDIDQILRALEDEWGALYVGYYNNDYDDGYRVYLRNFTDQGLGPDPKRCIEAESLAAALEEAQHEHLTGDDE